MKSLILSLVFGVFVSDATAQFTTSENVTYTNTNVGITTTAPNGTLSLGTGAANNKLLVYDDGHDVSGFGQATSEFRLYSPSSGSNHMSFGLYSLVGNAFAEQMRLDHNGNLGIGITIPQARLHITDVGTSVNAVNEYSGNLIIQANPGSRSATSGASLEFVIPANTDGGNPWGQARIITVAGNSGNTDATGKLILGTRRLFDKGVGTGLTWNYGDDLVIDGSGNVGVGTANPNGYKLAVKGTLHSQVVQVDMNGWSDYVFKPTYKLAPLSEVKTYIDQNHHLPEIPSAAQVAKDGINLGEMNAKLLKKIEELTLYLIEKDNQINSLKNLQSRSIAKQQRQFNKLKKQLCAINSRMTQL